MTLTSNDPPHPNSESGAQETSDRRISYVKVGEMRPTDDPDTCLRPLGLCELGGSCDSCWYRPDHPRFQNR